MKTETGDLKPEVGYAIVQFVPPGETAGGLVVPESAQHATGKLIVIETSGAYVVDGCRQEVSAQPGDRVWLNPHKHRQQDSRGKWVEFLRPRLSPIDGAENHFLCMLVDVTHYERPMRELNS